MGWEVAEGPELEAEWLNFDALNFILTILRAPCRTRCSSSRKTAASCCGPTRRRYRCGRCYPRVAGLRRLSRQGVPVR